MAPSNLLPHSAKSHPAPSVCTCYPRRHRPSLCSRLTVLAHMTSSIAAPSSRPSATTPRCAAILPFVKLFYGRHPRSFGKTKRGLSSAVQAEGGEQRDPLMPALFALGVAPAPEAVQAEMQPNERVRASLDDVYVTSHPPRVAHLLARLQHHLFAQAHIRLTPTKARVTAPVAPDGSGMLWVGDAGFPASERGLRILGTPLGTPENISAQLETLSTQHGALFARLTCRLPGSCCCFAHCHGHNMYNMSSGFFCLRTKRRTSPPRMTSQSLPAWPHFSVLSPPERSWQTVSHAGARNSPCNMVALGSAAAHAHVAYLRRGPMLCRP